MKGKAKSIIISIIGFALALVMIFLSERLYFGPKEAEAKVEAYIADHSFGAKDVDLKYNWYSGGGYIGDGYRYNPDSDMIFDEHYAEV